MAVAIHVNPVPPFDPHSEPSSVSQRWKKWVKSFELFAAASGCTDDSQKRQLFLHCAGGDVQDIFDTLADTGDSFGDAKNGLDNYFIPQTNTTYNRHQFRKEKQREGETIAQYVTRLRRLAADCGFQTDHVSEFIRDQVIDCCLSQRLCTKLLAEKSLTLNRLLELAQAMEASESQAAQISHDGTCSVRRVQSFNHRKPRQQQTPNPPPPQSKRCSYRHSNHRVSDRRQPPGAVQNNQSNRPRCSRCGILGHKGDECRISRTVTCFKCNKVGHFATCCRSTATSFARPQIEKPKVRHLQEEHTEDISSDENIYAFYNSKEDLADVYINNTPVSMIIDNGASCNVINWNIAKQCGLSPVPCNKILRPYLSPPVHCKFQAFVTISAGDVQATDTAVIIAPDDAPPLLGRDTAKQLGVLKVVLPVNHVPTVNICEEIAKKYPGIDKGIGRLRDFEVKLYIDESVPPVQRKHNRVPIHLRSKVEKEIQRLLNEDIIEPVTGPTTWVSSIVTPPKPKSPNEIRICVDMREANRAIQRTRHVTPTLEELIADLNGATVFSKIDLRSGYHQLQLDEKSRDITAFSSHVGLFRFKRLIMGVNSAAEVFQHTVQTVIAGICGARNISDDIIIFGCNEEDHDRALHETLRRIHQAGMTINLGKCLFRQPQIEFFGHIFGPDGISPDPKKVADLKNTPEPKNAGEVRSFLGMAQYSAKFIPRYATLTADLRELTKKDTPWEWSCRHAKAFEDIKDALSETATNAYFNPQKEVVIFVDASPVGLAAVLTQEDKPVAYASRSLSDVEQRYSQTEREALAVVWACEHFSLFVIGTRFKVVTDHLPLLGIWKRADLRQLRLARWALRLSTFDVEIKYQPGKDIRQTTCLVTQEPPSQTQTLIRLQKNTSVLSAHLLRLLL